MTDEGGLRVEAETVLRALAGNNAQLRSDQWTAIEALVVGRKRVLCVQRTGWGKSAVYFVATALLRRRDSGPTLIVSPLLALMRNQIEAAKRAGIAAETINSANIADWNNVYDEILENKVDVLLVSPERLNHPDFRDYILPKIAAVTGLVVVDEAHCISDWGHDFRPDYRRIRTLLAQLSPQIPVLATTATANERVIADVADQLGETKVLRGSLDRESLRLCVIPFPRSADRLAWLGEHLNDLPGSGIIYALTVGTAEQAAEYLRARGHAVMAYSAQTENDERRAAEDDLLNNRVKALVATSALGMGFDKPDLGFVVHVGAPPSPISYYQQIGRAGRALSDALVVLLPSDQDLRVWQYFTSLAFPAEHQVRKILDALANADRPLSTPVLETYVDLSRGGLEHVLRVLDVDGAVRRVQGGWTLTGEPWEHDTVRYERVSAARQAELASMLQYIATDSCRLKFLRDCLDDHGASPCGRCDNCTEPFVSASVSTSEAESLSKHLAKAGIELSPRAMWPTGLQRLGISLSGRIASGELCDTGRAVARLTDMGWGEEVSRVLAAEDQRIPDRLLQLAHRVLDEFVRALQVDAPLALVGIRSRRRPLLTESLFAELSASSGLPFLGSVAATNPESLDKKPNNAGRVATLQAGLLPAASTVETLQSAATAVLLIDDFVDSGWTMTLAGRALRRAGAARVLPFALATTGRRD